MLNKLTDYQNYHTFGLGVYTLTKEVMVFPISFVAVRSQIAWSSLFGMLLLLLPLKSPPFKIWCANSNVFVGESGASIEVNRRAMAEFPTLF